MSTLALENESGRTINFKQVFATERGEDVYCILRPLTSVSGAADDAAFVFKVDGDGAFRAVKDEKISNAVFAEYYEALNGVQRGDEG